MDPILKIADEHEPRLARALHKAFRDTQKSANISKFLAAYQRGNLTGAIDALKVSELEKHLIDG